MSHAYMGIGTHSKSNTFCAFNHVTLSVGEISLQEMVSSTAASPHDFKKIQLGFGSSEKDDKG